MSRRDPAVTDISIVVLALDGTIRFWNEGAERLFGRCSEQAEGCNFMDIALADESKGQVAEILTGLRTGRELRGLTDAKRPGGGRLPLYHIGLPMWAPDGGITGAVTISSHPIDAREIEEVARDIRASHMN